jgi:aconitate hydratase
MGAELGVTTSVFPSDAVTRTFLAAQGRVADWVGLTADDGAGYEQTVEIDLGAVEPMAACPHSPGNVASIASMAGRRVNQVLIGSCTNSAYRDLKTVALMMRGRKVHSTWRSAWRRARGRWWRCWQGGLLADLVQAGVRMWKMPADSASAITCRQAQTP